MELIKIEEREGKRTVNARNLHIILDSKQGFSHWITDRIEKYGFIKDNKLVAPGIFGFEKSHV